MALIAIAAPTISATILDCGAGRARPGLSELYSRLIQWRFGLKWYALILLGIPFLGWLTTLVAGATPVYVLSSPALADFDFAEPDVHRSFMRGAWLARIRSAASAQTIQSAGCQPDPGAVLGSMASAVLLHIQRGAIQPFVADAFLVFGLFTSILMTWIFQHTGGSVTRRSPVPLHGEHVAFNHRRTVGGIRGGVDGVWPFWWCRWTKDLVAVD